VTSTHSRDLPALGDLEVKATEGGIGVLAPPFSRGTFDYHVDVQSDIGEIRVTPRSAGDKTAVTVQGRQVSSGESVKVPLETGENVVRIEVSSRGGRALYSLTVTRQDMSPVVRRFKKLSFQDPGTGVTLGYRLFVPESPGPAGGYPLVLFLHGAGESGSDNEAQLTANQGATVWARPEEQARHPCVVLAPQNPKDPAATAAWDFGKNGWTSLMGHGFGQPFDPEPSLRAAYALLRKVMEQYPVDPRRVYATGLSMGGFGVYAMAAEHPGTFAAVVGICGGLDPSRAAALAGTPVWAFHAEEDPVVPVRFSRATVTALKQAGGNPRYTEYGPRVFFSPDAHVSWVPTYANREVRDWIFQQNSPK
jgi:predicted peptidase